MKNCVQATTTVAAVVASSVQGILFYAFMDEKYPCTSQERKRDVKML